MWSGAGSWSVSKWLIAACGIAYLITAADLARQKNYPMALAFVGYFIGNVGLYYAV